VHAPSHYRTRSFFGFFIGALPSPLDAGLGGGLTAFAPLRERYFFNLAHYFFLPTPQFLSPIANSSNPFSKKNKCCRALQAARFERFFFLSINFDFCELNIIGAQF